MRDSQRPGPPRRGTTTTSTRLVSGSNLGRNGRPVDHLPTKFRRLETIREDHILGQADNDIETGKNYDSSGDSSESGPESDEDPQDEFSNNRKVRNDINRLVVAKPGQNTNSKRTGTDSPRKSHDLLRIYGDKYRDICTKLTFFIVSKDENVAPFPEVPEVTVSLNATQSENSASSAGEPAVTITDSNLNEGRVCLLLAVLHTLVFGQQEFQSLSSGNSSTNKDSLSLIMDSDEIMKRMFDALLRRHGEWVRQVLVKMFHNGNSNSSSSFFNAKISDMASSSRSAVPSFDFFSRMIRGFRQQLDSAVSSQILEQKLRQNPYFCMYHHYGVLVRD